MLPPASRLLRLLNFTVPAALAVAAVQPLLGAGAGFVGLSWAAALALPALAAALAVLGAGRLGDVGSREPPWYTAWALLPGAFFLAGAGSMCIFGALVQYPGLPSACWWLLALGVVSWAGAVAVVRKASA